MEQRVGGIRIHVNQMRDSPRGRVDWGLSDCFLRKRLSYSCDTYIFTCVATYNIYLHSVIILLPDLLTNSPRLGIRLCSCSPSRPPVAKFASDKFQDHIFASVWFLTSFIKSSSMAVKTKASSHLISGHVAVLLWCQCIPCSCVFKHTSLQQ